jgi:hypothetical protein
MLEDNQEQKRDSGKVTSYGLCNPREAYRS